MTQRINKALVLMLAILSITAVSCSKTSSTDSTKKSNSNESEAKTTSQNQEQELTTSKTINKVPSNKSNTDSTEAYIIPSIDDVKMGGNFIISNSTEPDSLDPQQIQGDPEYKINVSLFEGLVENDPQTSKAIPGVASSWEFSDDRTVITFHLREDAKWSDGTPLTANDFVYSWQRELQPETAAPYSWFPEMFLKGGAEYAAGTVDEEGLGVKALDDYTLQVELVGPLPYAIDAFAHFTFNPVPQKCIEEYGDQWTQPGKMVSNGAFVLSEHVSQSYIKVVKNDTFWDSEHVYLDSITYLASDDENTNYNMYLDGDIDWLTSVSTERVSAAQMRNDYQVHTQLASSYYDIQFENPVLKDVNVRQALSYAIDRDSLVDNILKGGQIPAWSVIPAMSGYDAKELPFDSYDEAVEIAQEKMAEAGYPNGIGFPKITLLYNSNEGNKKIAEFLQSNFKDVLGIDCTLENQEWGTFISNRDNGNFQLARDGWVGDYQDPNTFLEIFISNNSMNGGDYANSEFDALLKKASTMIEGPERFDVLHQAEDILVADQAFLPLYYNTSNALIDTDKWGGWFPNTMDYHPTRFIYLKK